MAKAATRAVMAQNEQVSTVSITLPALVLREMEIDLVGDSPLICHAWSEKAKREMREKQMKKAKTAREAEDNDADFRACLYVRDDGAHGFPATAFKSAAVDACSSVAGITKVEARGAFHIIGDLPAIDGDPNPREDMVRIGMGTADIRYRAEFREWRVRLRIRFNANVLSAEQIINLFNTAGFAVGVGDWRPQKDGSYGMFHVEIPQ